MNYVPRIITPPSWEPIDASDVLQHSRISDAAEASYVTMLIKAARQHLEGRCGMAFIEQVIEFALPYWPCHGIIELPRATPLNSVTSVKYVDSTGAEHTLDASDYVLDTYSRPGCILPAYGTTWPAFVPFPANAVRIRYSAGYVEASPAVGFPDEDIKHALRFLVAHFYEHREAVAMGENVTILPAEMELAMSALLVNHELPAF